jgi:ParB family chromosome partitioning protein
MFHVKHPTNDRRRQVTTGDKQNPKRLGRGLAALLGPAASATAGAFAAAAAGGRTGDTSPLRSIPISEIRPNPFQPRKAFRAEELAELQASLAASGLLQPITVRAAEPGFELIAGERRLRAATGLGWTEISAIVVTLDDEAALTLALVENLQRADLNPMEEAEGYQRLMTEFALTQQSVATAVGKDRSTVANILRLLLLPDALRQMVRDGALSVGHARALLGAKSEPTMEALAREVVARGLSVREVERRVRDNGKGRAEARPPKATRPGATASTGAVRSIEDALRAYLQTDVRVDLSGPDAGTIAIRFYSTDDLERVLELVMRNSPIRQGEAG